MIFWASVTDAVLREELTVLIALQPVALIALTVVVGLLDASSRRGIIAGNGQADHGVIGKLHGLLHQSLAEGTTADDGATVVVLNGACEDFRSRS